MSTTLIPLDPAATAGQSTRILTISASLLPEEIVDARQARRTRGVVLVVVAVVAVLCAAWFVLALHQKQEAEAALDETSQTVTALQRDQREFAETLQVQAETKLLDEQLTAVMAKDLDWAALLTTLRAAGARTGITIDDVSGQVAKEDAATSTAQALPGSTTDTIGTLLISGEGSDKAAVAAYVDALGRQAVVTNPYVTSVASVEDGDGVTFSLRVDLTRAALCGRFTDPCTTSGGN